MDEYPKGLGPQAQDFFEEFRFESLLDLTWSDGDYFEKGEVHDIFTPDEKDGLRFWKNMVYQGHQVVTFYDDVVYDDSNALRRNQITAQRIKTGINEGYETPFAYVYSD